MVMANSTCIGWIGTGVMGSAMCSHLVDAGFEVLVTTRTPAKAALLIDKGAHWCSSPREVALKSSVIITMLGTPDDVREVYFGAGAVLQTASEGTAFIDMTTSEPPLAEQLFQAAAARGIDALDAPVTGGDAGARQASLAIMVGGTKAAYERVLPLLRLLGRVVTLQGGPGAGQHAKMVNQIAIASGMMAVCEALLYAYRAGLNMERVISTLSGGAAGSWLLSNTGPKILAGDLEPGFQVNHFIKDLGIALREARRLTLALPGLALAQQLYVGVAAQGLGAASTTALAATLSNLSGMSWPPEP
jgi:3-hydroxyisobutyrate dehydrogenase